MKGAILRNVINLLERAPLTPGGQNIGIATENLNQYFEGTDPSEFALSSEVRDYLAKQLAEAPFSIDTFETITFEIKDARHIEDCLLYHNIASRLAGPGKPLERVHRLFDWTVRNVQLIPVGVPVPEGLTERGLDHVPARPYDVLVRGLGSEVPGDPFWAERSWVFMVLCRQIGIDVGMIAYEVEGRDRPYAWTCAALIDGEPYLFDTRRGMAIPGPDGTGIATLEQAATNPTVLDRLDLPEPAIDYPTRSSDLETVRVLIDSSRGFFAPKMRLLQRDLAGANRMVLYRNPVEQRDAWASALGNRLVAVDLWELPMSVEYRLFNDPGFVGSTQLVNQFFQAEVPMPDGSRLRLPLLGARLRHLQGDLDEAKQAYTRFRFRQALPHGREMVPIPPELSHALDLFATYFLGLCQLEQGNDRQAAFFFEQALTLPPGSPMQGNLATLTLWGARSNLGMVYERMGQIEPAIHYDSLGNPTPQSHADLLRANALLFQSPPFGPAPPPAGASDTPEVEGDTDTETKADTDTTASEPASSESP